MNIYFSDDYHGDRGESHRLLERAFAEHTGDEERAKKLIGALKKGEHGKPYIDGFCCFSISHTGSIWAALIADKECGLDIQHRKNCNYRSIAKRFFAPGDSEVNSADEFFRIWARREALVKAVGGTVYDNDIPPVLESHVIIDGKTYVIYDLDFEGHRELYSAICTEGGSPCIAPEFCKL